MLYVSSYSTEGYEGSIKDNVNINQLFLVEE